MDASGDADLANPALLTVVDGAVSCPTCTDLLGLFGILLNFAPFHKYADILDWLPVPPPMFPFGRLR